MKIRPAFLAAGAILSFLSALPAEGSDTLPINDRWRFHYGFQAPAHEISDVTLPHTWNRKDAMFGDKNYFRGLCNYSRMLPAGLMQPDKRVFLKVNAAQTVADVFIDNHFVTQHRGGYTAFVTEITDYLTPGKESLLEIRVSNAPTMDVAPICGDFNIYGGLPRGVELIITDPVCIAPDFHASPGVFFFPEEVNEQAATLKGVAYISSGDASVPADGYEVEFTVRDDDRVVFSGTTDVKDFGSPISLPVKIDRPRLWNGTSDPHIYTGRVELRQDGRTVDIREVPVGLRNFEATADGGFFLNGKPYRLNGVNRHEDVAERASALTLTDHSRDVDIIREMGCNAVRMSHYPQSESFVSMLDSAGLAAWIEIPFVNVYVNNPAYDENLTTQLKEMIYQYHHHPSVFAWGLFNEINSGWLDRPSDMVTRLDSIAHSIDPSRMTMGASNQNDDFNGFTDIIAFNKYFGWYAGDPEELGTWLDEEHAAHPERKIGMSEYGAGGSVMQQSAGLVRPEPWGHRHPENWQTHYHIESYRQLARRDWLWCNFIWCMFDFCAASRDEGDTPGRNDKGLVTYDRQTRKDAFYFYKANWNKADKFVHIAGKREPRSGETTTIMAFSNDGAGELYVDGRKFGKASPDEVNVLIWEDVPLSPEGTMIEVRTTHGRDSMNIRQGSR
ncbi:MAG: glycoside hydrolase family 2 protein [Muribaculaceae bacterium]|nr:glycoside hydrolase family 2 protein [Muribaculaceae bacterium]